MNALGILESLKSDNNLWFASSANIEYHRIWLRDSAWMLLPYIFSQNYAEIRRALKGFFNIIAIFKEKLEDGDLTFRLPPCYLEDNSPSYVHDYRTGYDASKQNDIIGEWLWIIAQIWDNQLYVFSAGEIDLIQKMVMYLVKIHYWQDKDSGYWEESTDIRASSIGICLAGLVAIEKHVFVPDFLIIEGSRVINKLGYYETEKKKTDAAQLSLIWPFAAYDTETTNQVLANVMSNLYKKNGCIRYAGDQYYMRHGLEMEWPLLQMQLAIIGYPALVSENIAQYNFPEGFYGATSIPNPNTPLGWCASMYWMYEMFYK